MLYSPKFILTTDGTIGCAISDTLCQMVWHQIVDARDYLLNVVVVAAAAVEERVLEPDAV